MWLRQRLVKLSGLVMVGALAVAGCGGESDELPREAISGTVTLDGAPLPHGYIQFQPTSEKGVAAGGNITEGKFSIDRAQGPVPGDYRVLISSIAAAESTSAEPPAPGAPTAPPPDPIPAIYNTKTTLKATIEKGHSKPFEFTLDSKKKK